MRKWMLAAVVNGVTCALSGCGDNSTPPAAQGGAVGTAGTPAAGAPATNTAGSAGMIADNGGAAMASAGATSGGSDAVGGSDVGGAPSFAGQAGSTASAGSSASGSTGSSGGSNASAGAGSGGRLTPQDAVKLMSPGWNLGNSFDGNPNVTSWGNPAPTQAFIKTLHAAGFKTLRLPVTWTSHIGAGPAYTVDASWLNQVKQTAQWATDEGMYVFVNTHHEADGNGGWVSFPQGNAATNVATEVSAVWTQLANAFKSFDSHLMFECFNEPNEAGGGNTAQAQTDLNLYLEACFKAVRGTGGSNATRIVMIQPVGASPIQSGIQAMQKVSFIDDPNLVISLHTYYPTNFGLSTTPYAWGKDSDYTAMQNSIAQQIRVWLPTQVIFVGEWGSMGAQSTANRAAHALAYAQDTTTAGIVPIWWDNGGSGSGSFALFNRSSGAQTFPTIVSGIMTGVKNGLAAPNTWATPANP